MANIIKFGGGGGGGDEVTPKLMFFNFYTARTMSGSGYTASKISSIVYDVENGTYTQHNATKTGYYEKNIITTDFAEVQTANEWDTIGNNYSGAINSVKILQNGTYSIYFGAKNAVAIKQTLTSGTIKTDASLFGSGYPQGQDAAQVVILKWD